MHVLRSYGKGFLTMNRDLFFMDQAYKQAQKAFKAQEIPIGAVLVSRDGHVLAQGYNQVEKKQNTVLHAEMIVIQKASKKLESWRLVGATLYVTVQPCLMCLGAIFLARIPRVVYGIESAKYGVFIDQVQKLGIYQNLHTVAQCIHYEPAKTLLQLFFRKKRSMQYVNKKRIDKG